MSQKSSSDQKRSQAARARKKEAQQRKQYIQHLIREQKRERDALLFATMKRANKVGLYNPKELKLTKYRRSRANKILQEFGDTLNPEKFFFVKLPKKGLKKNLAKAVNLEVKASRTGLFIPKAGYTSAKVKYDKKHDELYIDVSGKIKRGSRRGKSHRKIIPLTTLDVLANEKQRIIDLAKKLGPLQPGERLAFTTEEQGFQGYSRQTFKDINKLLEYLERYQNSVASFVNFYRHITIVKTTPSVWFSVHPFKDKLGREYKPRKMVHRGKA